MAIPAFDPAKIYRFFICFHDGEEEDAHSEIRHFAILLTPENHDRYLTLDDHTDGAWTNHWRRTAWKYGQLGLCTNDPQGIFGFDTNEIDRPRKRAAIMRSWQRFHERHGFAVGEVETTMIPAEDEIEYDGKGFVSSE